MTTDTEPLAKFSWHLKSNTGLTSDGSQDNVTPEMYGQIMGVLAGSDLSVQLAFQRTEITRLQGLLQEAPRYFSHHDFDGDKLKWLQAAGLA